MTDTIFWRASDWVSLLTTPAPLPALQSSQEVTTEMVEVLSRTAILIVAVLVLAILVPVLFLVYRRFFASLNAPAERPADPAKEIEKLERRGDFAAAAALCEQGGDFTRAAALFEKAKDPARAADMYESAGDLKKAVDHHLRSGGALKAAGLYIKMGQFMDAAKIFRNKGDHYRAAQALEMFGNKVAAAAEYREAGHFERAAKLLKEEGMYAEAAEAYLHTLKGGRLEETNVDGYYNYAAFLALAGRREEAVGIYRSIMDLKGDYRKVKGNLHALGIDVGAPPAPAATSPGDPSGARSPAVARGGQQERAAGGTVPAAGLNASLDTSPEAGEDEPLRKFMSLRNMIAYGNLEPRYAMRIWLQILKALAEKHREHTFYGSLAPEDIRIDMQNSVEIVAPNWKAPAYTAPEVLGGEAPGPHSDIYSLGVILFEMVTGSLDRLGEARPIEIREDIPAWLDEMIIRCTKKDRRDRFLNAEDVLASMVRLKSAMQERD